MSLISNIVQIDPDKDSLYQTLTKMQDNLKYIEQLVQTSAIKGEISDISEALTSAYGGVTMETATSTVDIGIEKFDRNADSLVVFVNNNPIQLNTDYTISADSTKIQKTSGMWAGGTRFDFAVMSVNPSASQALFKAMSVYTDVRLKREVFTIVNPNDGTGHFTYTDEEGKLIIGNLTSEGGQIFMLQKGEYVTHDNRIDIIISDTLKRSEASGGLIEVDSKRVALTFPESVGIEVTIEYFNQLGLSTGGSSASSGDNTYIGVNSPPSTAPITFWYKEVT